MLCLDLRFADAGSDYAHNFGSYISSAVPLFEVQDFKVSLISDICKSNSLMPSPKIIGIILI
jgi:hypothetical protein